MFTTTPTLVPLRTIRHFAWHSKLTTITTTTTTTTRTSRIATPKPAHRGFFSTKNTTQTLSFLSKIFRREQQQQLHPTDQTENEHHHQQAPASSSYSSMDAAECKQMMKRHLDQVEYLLEVERMGELEAEIEDAFQLAFVHPQFLSAADPADVKHYLDTLLEKVYETRLAGYRFQQFVPYRASWAAAMIAQEIQQWERALKYMTNAFELCDGDLDKMGLMKISMGSIHAKMGQWESAEMEHRAGLEMIGARVNLQNGLQVGTAYSEIAQYHLKQINNPTTTTTTTTSTAAAVDDDGTTVDDVDQQEQLSPQEHLKMAIKGLERAYTIFESYYGWHTPATVDLAQKLSKLYFENNRLDLGIIIAEKAFVAMELCMQEDNNDPRQIVQMGMYLAKAYEKKRLFDLQQNTITRTMNFLKHREEQFDPQLYKECYFKLQNMLGACRYLLNDNVIALSIFQKMSKLVDEIYPKWSERNPAEANMEIGYMHYFMGSCQVGVNRFDDGIQTLQTAKEFFTRAGANAWVQYSDKNIVDAEKMKQEQQQQQQAPKQ